MLHQSKTIIVNFDKFVDHTPVKRVAAKLYEPLLSAGFDQAYFSFGSAFSAHLWIPTEDGVREVHRSPGFGPSFPLREGKGASPLFAFPDLDLKTQDVSSERLLSLVRVGRLRRKDMRNVYLVLDFLQKAEVAYFYDFSGASVFVAPAAAERVELFLRKSFGAKPSLVDFSERKTLGELHEWYTKEEWLLCINKKLEWWRYKEAKAARD
ncbi:MAG: hypothetical protein AAF517_11390 [Planctomycetota bacterium]